MILYKNFYSIIFILLFFSQFAVYIIPGTTAGNISIGLMGVLLLYIFIAITNYKKFIIFIKDLINIPVVKLFLFYIIYVTVLMIVHIFMGHYKAPSYYYFARIYRFYIYSIPIFFFPVVGLFSGFKIEHFAKLLCILFLIVFITGIVQYIGLIFNIGFIETIINCITNARATLYFDGGINTKVDNRVFSIFSEPSSLGQFIFIFMPIIVILSRSKYKIFRNTFLDNLSKKTIVLFMFINLILTKSPIYLVLCIIEILILLILINIQKIKKFFVEISLIAFAIILSLSISYMRFQNLVENSYIIRIINTISHLTNFNSLVTIEPSLASRIVNYMIQFVSLKYHPLFGAGLCNIDVFLNDKYFRISPLPFTVENVMFYYNTSFVTATNKSVIWTSLAEFGLIGFFLYFAFVFKLFKNVLKLLKQHIYTGIKLDLLMGLIGALISIFFISFYNISIDNSNLWIIYGLVISYIYNTKFINKEESNV